MGIQIGESVVLLIVPSMIETRKFTLRGSRLAALPAKTRQTFYAATAATRAVPQIRQDCRTPIGYYNAPQP